MSTCPSHMMEQYEKENSLLNSIIQQYYTKNIFGWFYWRNKGKERESRLALSVYSVQWFLYAAKANKVCLGSLKRHIRNDVQSHTDPRGAKRREDAARNTGHRSQAAQQHFF